MSWDNFFTAEVGAAAALAGLIFVGISINLQRIVQLPMVANRALQSLLVLLSLLGIESLLLVPGPSPSVQGVSVAGIAIATGLALNLLERRSWREVEPRFRAVLRNHTVEIQLPWVLVLLGGIALLTNSTGALYWFVPATLGGFLIAVVEAWIITVEILR